MKVQTLIEYGRLKEKGVSYGKCRLWQLEAENKFPKRVRLSAVRVAWVESEIDQWIADRITQRDQMEVA
jgi:prophage regulatory protein